MMGHGTGRKGHGMGHGKILGTTTIGERGQVVIPASAREELGIQAGDKFVVFGDKRKGSVALVRADVFDEFAEFFMSKSKKLEKIAQSIIDKKNAFDDLDDEEEADEETE